MTEVDIAHLRKWIGREERKTDVLTIGLAERFRATLGGKAIAPGEALPLAIHWCLAPAAVPPEEIGGDGHPARGGFLPPVPLPRRMWAGGELRFHRPLGVGDAVERLSRIADVAEKAGRTGRLVFVTVEHEISIARGLAVSERQDLVYREAQAVAASPVTQAAAVSPATKAVAASPAMAASTTAQAGAASPLAQAAAASSVAQAAAASPTPAAPGGPRPADVSLSIDATTVLLFRYSALTFNGHRIHYDRDYARDVEAYPGLVVHGPLQATLLANLAARLSDGRPPRRFSYRGVSPLFDGAPFTLNAARANGGLDLWCADRAGATTMTATAEY